jgi:hypothetical protein
MHAKTTHFAKRGIVLAIISLLTLGSFNSFAQPGSSTRLLPGTAVNTVPGGPTSYAWVNPLNAVGDDGVTTISTMPGRKRTQLLTATQFGFVSSLTPGDIPPTATISGIVVQIKKKATGKVADFSVLIVKGGATTGVSHALGAAWPSTLTYVSYGGSTDNWGAAWTVADVTASGFGVQVQAKGTAKGSNIAEIDNIKITIYFNQTPYYSKATGSLATLGTWGTNLDGTGTAPLSFTSDGQTFNLCNRAATTLDAPLTISGIGSKFVVGLGAVATALTIPSGFALTAPTDVKNLGNLIIQNTTEPTLGTLDPGSEVNYNAAVNQDVQEANYGKLTISGGAIKTLLTAGVGASDVSSDLSIATTTTFNLNYPVTVEGNFISNGTTGGTAEITLDAAVAQTVSGTGTINDLAIDNSAGGATQVTFSGAQSFISLLRCINGVVANGTNFIPLNGCVLNIEDGSINAAITSANTYDVLYTSTISKSTANETTGSGLRNVTLNLFDNTIVITGGANITMSGNLLLTSGELNASSRTINVGGDFTNNSIFTRATSTIGFTGSAAVQNIGGLSPIIFNNVTINKASGRAQLMVDASMSGTMTLTSGIMNTNNFTYTMNGTSSSFAGIVFGAARTSFISTAQSSGADGISGGLKIQSIGTGGRTGNVVFPVGNSFTSYNAVQINNTGTSDNFTVNVTAGVPPGASAPDCVNRTWNIGEDVPGGTTATLAMQWNASQENISFIRAVARVFHTDGTQVDFAGSPTAASGSDPYNVSGAPVGGFTTFSPYGVGSNLVVLPVSLNNISAKVISSGVEVRWQNVSEREVKQYFVERSSDGRNFQSVSSQTAVYNNGSVADYRWIDNASASGDVFYRIKAEDISGRTTISSVVRVRKNTQPFISINPNPVQDREMNLNMNSLPEGKYSLVVADAQGRVIMNTSVTTDGSFKVIRVSLPSAVTKGFYMLKMNSETGSQFSQKFLVQ